MKCIELRKMTYAKLREARAESMAQFAAESLKIRAGKAQNTCLRRVARRNIARVATVMTEKRKEEKRNV